MEALGLELGGRENDVVCVHELQPKLGRREWVGEDGSVMGEEGRGEGDGVDAEFPAFWVAGHDGVSGRPAGAGGRGEEGVAEELVAEAGAEYFYGWVVGVEFWEQVVSDRRGVTGAG
jgi:hypothetical protein